MQEGNESEDGAMDICQSAPSGEGVERLYCCCEVFINGLSQPSVLVTHWVTSRMLRVIPTRRGIGALDAIDGGQGVVFFLNGGVQIKLSIGA